MWQKILLLLALELLTSCVSKEIPDVKSPCVAIDSEGNFINPCIKRRPINQDLV